MKKILLPRDYLSWSQMWLWEKSPEKYKEKYFYGAEQYVTKEMVFGRKFADAVETGKTDNPSIKKTLKSVIAYEYREYEVRCLVKSGKDVVPIFCKLDSYKKGFVREDKTGKTPWTQLRAENHGQLGFYDVAINIVEGKIPMNHLDWFETEEKVKGVITLTGRMETFPVKKTTLDILKMTARIIKVAKQISEAYQAEF